MRNRSKGKFSDRARGALASRPGALDAFRPGGVFRVVCRDGAGREKWTEERHNAWVTEGLNRALESLTKSGVTDSLFVGLKDTAVGIDAADTAAQIGGTNGWGEAVPYSEGTRPAYTAGTAAAGSIDNSASVASFSINGTDVIHGAFLINESTKSGTSGELYCVVDFAASRNVESGDTLEVTYTLTAADS